MMIVLDTLKSDDPGLRRIGETWMRCSLKSYLRYTLFLQWIAEHFLICCRVLDPILYELLDPSIHRIPSTAKVRGRELQIYIYERPFDQRYAHHLLEMLLSIMRFGGQGFSKTAKTTFIRRSHHTGLVRRVESSKLPLSDIISGYIKLPATLLGGTLGPDASYLDALVEILLRCV